MKKILYSPGYGAGWSTWQDDNTAKFLLTYEPIIDFLESGGKFSYDECRYGFVGDTPDVSTLHPLLATLLTEVHERFGNYPYFGGARDLVVFTVSNGEAVRVIEYDGNESIQYGNQVDWVVG